MQDLQEKLVESVHLEHAVLLQRYWMKMNYLIPKEARLEVKDILALS